MRLSRRIRVDKRYSARLDYRWHRACGLSRRECVSIMLHRYGWNPAEPLPMAGDLFDGVAP